MSAWYPFPPKLLCGIDFTHLQRDSNKLKRSLFQFSMICVYFALCSSSPFLMAIPLPPSFLSIICLPVVWWQRQRCVILFSPQQYLSSALCSCLFFPAFNSIHFRAILAVCRHRAKSRAICRHSRFSWEEALTLSWALTWCSTKASPRRRLWVSWPKAKDSAHDEQRAFGRPSMVVP